MVGKVVFLDASSPVLYSAASLDDPETRIGGAEITTIRIAAGLAPTHDVTVGQLTRPAARPLAEDGVRWTSLVSLESQAVGTPVLAHRFGSALEFLSEEETLDATDAAAVEARIALWRSGGRPSPKLDDALRIEAVLKRWDSFISAHRPRAATAGPASR